MKAFVASSDPGWIEAVGSKANPACSDIKVAQDGPSAIATLQTSNFDIVLLDARTPLLGDPGLYAKIRDRFPATVIAVRPASSTRSDVTGILQGGADDVIPDNDLDVWFTSFFHRHTGRARSDSGARWVELDIDHSGTIVDASDTVREVLGWSPIEIKQRNIEDIVFCKDAHLRPLALLLSGGGCADCRIKTASGAARFGRMELITRNPALSPVIKVRVVDEAKEDRVEPRVVPTSFASQTSIAEAVRDGMVMLDRKGRILYANEVAGLLVGHAKEQLAGKSIDEILSGNDPARGRSVSQMLPETFRTGKFEVRNARLRRSDGGVVNCEARISEVHTGTDGSHFAVAIRPTSAREMHESRARESARMEAMTSFAGRLANDFNNALAAVSGSIESAMMCSKPEDVRSELDSAFEATRRAARLVRRLTNFAHPAPSKKAKLDPGMLVERAVTALRKEIDPRITIKMDIDHGDWLCEADADQIVDTIISLGYNARDAMPGGGTLSIRTATTTREGNGRRASSGSSDFARIDVEDTGCGIPGDVLPHIFDPMFTTHAGSAGAGLGLARVYDVLKQHGGGITVESTVNSGTRFHIFLPRASGSTAPRPVQPAFQKPELAGTVLVIDDEETVRRPCVRALETSGFKVLQAADGKSGIELIDQNAGRLSAIILDIVMPGVNGWDVLAHVRTRHPNLPVLMVSGYSGTTVDPARQQFQPDGFLQKPFELRELIDQVTAMGPGATAG